MDASGRLANQKREILLRWEAAARATLGPARRRSRTALLGGIPALLDELVVALDATAESAPGGVNAADEHARQRAPDAECSPAELALEFQLLRGAVLDVLESDGPIDRHELRVILHTLDGALSETIAHIGRLRAAALRDPGERESTEDRFRSVVDTVVDGVITIDEHGVIQTFNPAAQRIFGFSVADVVGRNVKMLMPPPYRAEHDGYMRHHRETGERRIIGIGREVTGLRKDGTTFPMDLAVSEFHVGNERLFTGIVRDVTERKTMEAELRRRAEELAEASSRKDDFLAMLGHELRNPLSAIRSAVALMQRQDTDRRDQRPVQVIERQVQQVVRMVDDLLDVARLNRGRLNLQRQPVALERLLRDAVQTIRPMTDQVGQQVSVSVWPADLWLDADGLRITQVLVNLLHNASKFSEHGQAIDVTARADDGFVLIAISDRGVGIAPERLHKVFDVAEHRAHEIGARHGGLGIGLRLVQTVVGMHGGTVAAHSEGIGHGSRFDVRLPVIPAPAAASAPPLATTPVAHPPAALDVLVVDDNIDAAFSLAELLRRWGHKVRETHGGQQALQTLRDGAPRVALVDINMPGMDGYELARRIRSEASGREIHLVAVTGYGQPRDKVRARVAGFDDHFTKPPDLAQLREVLARIGAAAAQAEPRPTSESGAA